MSSRCFLRGNSVIFLVQQDSRTSPLTAVFEPNQTDKMVLHQYDYIFAIGTLFAMLDAYNNGASEYSSVSLLPSVLFRLSPASTASQSFFFHTNDFSSTDLPLTLNRRCGKRLGYQCLV